MRIGLISDSHNDHAAVERALTQMRLEGVSVLLHAGDMTSPQTLRLFRGFELWLARGNMDHDPALMPVATELFGAGHFLTTHTLQLDGAAVVLAHRADASTTAQLIAAGKYDYVVCGHTHRPEDRGVGTTRVINPGALHGPRWEAATYAILDLATGDLSWYRL